MKRVKAPLGHHTRIRVAECVLSVLEMSEPEIEQTWEYAREEYGNVVAEAFLDEIERIKKKYATAERKKRK